MKIAGFVEERGGGGGGTVLQFSVPILPVFINTIMKYSGDRNEVWPISESPFPAKTIKNCLKINEIESLKTEKSLNFVFMFLNEPCGGFSI